MELSPFEAIVAANVDWATQYDGLIDWHERQLNVDYACIHPDSALASLVLSIHEEHEHATFQLVTHQEQQAQATEIVTEDEYAAAVETVELTAHTNELFDAIYKSLERMMRSGFCYELAVAITIVRQSKRVQAEDYLSPDDQKKLCQRAHDIGDLLLLERNLHFTALR